MKFYFLPLFINSLISFEPKKLEGKWYQLATNDPTIPNQCNYQKLSWILNNDNKNYEVNFESKCFNVDIKIDLHGTIINNTLYENFKPLEKKHKNNIVNIVTKKNDYDIVELIAEYNVFNIYKKNIYQLWSRKILDKKHIQLYIDNAIKKYNISDVRLVNF